MKQFGFALLLTAGMGLATSCDQLSNIKNLAGGDADSVPLVEPGPVDGAPAATADASAGKKGEEAALRFYRSQIDRIVQLWVEKVSSSEGPARFSFIDVDGDGILELYVSNNSDIDSQNHVAALFCCGGDEVEYVANEYEGADLILCRNMVRRSELRGQPGSDTQYHVVTFHAFKDSRARCLDFFEYQSYASAETGEYDYYGFDPENDWESINNKNPYPREKAQQQLAQATGGDTEALGSFRFGVDLDERPITDIGGTMPE